MGNWSGLLGKPKIAKPQYVQRVSKLQLGFITSKRENDSLRARKWRKNNKEKLSLMHRNRWEKRRHLYIKGGKYYEARKVRDRAKFAAWQRARRAKLSKKRERTRRWRAKKRLC